VESDPANELQSEIELLRKVGHGDRRSFEQLYERFSEVLFSIAYRMLKSQEAAEDVLQDVFVQIWKKAPLFDPARGRPMTWAVTLTRNKAIDLMRSAQRRSDLHDTMHRETEAFRRFDDRSIFRCSRFGRAVEVGARRHRETLKRAAIELAFFASMTQTEIAEHLDEPLGTIKARIRRGMLALREMIEPQL
jgi:RNA polymerase sigma-70 factor, ECF subfamily